MMPEMDAGDRHRVLSVLLIQELDRIAPPLAAEHHARVKEVLAAVLGCCQMSALSLEEGSAGRVAADTPPQPWQGGELLPVGAYGFGNLSDGEAVDIVYSAPLHLQLARIMSVVVQNLKRRLGVNLIFPGGTDGLLRSPAISFCLRGLRVKLILSQQIPDLPEPHATSIVNATGGILARWAVGKVLCSVPDQAQFLFLLRLVRCWAKQRGIYGNLFGFIGGMAWSICAARVCQAQQSSDVSRLALAFFRIMSSWDWRRPIVLQEDEEQVDLLGSSAGGQPAHGPQRKVSVMLPVGIGISAAPHVPDTTAKILFKEFRRGYKLVRQVETSTAQWSDLFAPVPFFSRYQNYLQFSFFASSEEVLEHWCIWAQEQMTDLVHMFETMRSNSDTLRPWPFTTPFADGTWGHSRAMFAGLRLGKQSVLREQEGGSTVTLDDGTERRCFDFRDITAKFLEIMTKWPEADRYANMFDLVIRHVRQRDLEHWLQAQTGFAQL